MCRLVSAAARRATNKLKLHASKANATPRFIRKAQAVSPKTAFLAVMRLRALFRPAGAVAAAVVAAQAAELPVAPLAAALRVAAAPAVVDVVAAAAALLRLRRSNRPGVKRAGD